MLPSPARNEREGSPSQDGGYDLATVYDENFDYVWRCLKSLGVSEPHLDDALQEVFLVVQRKLPSFVAEANLRTWLYAIALRISRRSRHVAARDARRFLPSDWDVSTPPHGSTSVAARVHSDLRFDLEKQERLALAHRALQMMDGAKREFFVLSCLEELSAPELARIFEIPVNTAYSRTRLAREAFAEAVRRIERGEAGSTRQDNTKRGPVAERSLQPRSKP